jgi:hypothetical protein
VKPYYPNGKLIALEAIWQTVDGFGQRKHYPHSTRLLLLTMQGRKQSLLPQKCLNEGKCRLLLRYQQVLEEQRGI